MDLYRKLVNKQTRMAIVGLGYVGIQLAAAFAKKVEVIGLDINTKKINQYKTGIDITDGVGGNLLEKTSVLFTTDESKLSEALFYIVTVPTPVNCDKTPDLRPLIDASEMIGRNMNKGAFIVYESTVYPGLTEEVCIPILEQVSGFQCKRDFKVGYSPERINPSDRVHKLETIKKVVAGVDEESLSIIARVYELVIKAGVHKADSIRVAEAAKIMENCQRDINIAFINEIAMFLNKLNIDIEDVLKASRTKWNFIDFTPGLVGGHCIGVDPYYLLYQAEQLGHHLEIIRSGRRVNNSVVKYVIDNIIKKLLEAEIKIKGARVTIMGISYKEDVPDLRNTRVIDIIRGLKEYGLEIKVVDPVIEPTKVQEEYNIKLENLEDIKGMDVLIFAVPHQGFKTLKLYDLKKMYSGNRPVLIDLKGIFNKTEAQKMKFLYWSL
ncbi:nucleotide sugar dehydrogenase [Iocasia frigidifontis]|uniref:Nucleotide sugar dehydrogenase n=1 Tax=Iocasia fonsfrigidae TaxID=2682810 RepID=A0A8A7K7K7_9FIRM|nr:nucleotide sugar dehydrogenase [Iocasia fonsfrigidae]QTL97696.1 nucleotide sugar dehydrogenase [Iocasia fonsfrigidae]